MCVCVCVTVYMYLFMFIFPRGGGVAVLGRCGIGTGLGYVAVIKEGNSL